ncbi:DNA-binding transcriptional ArsR family regulator [Nocardia tenerifensis]|uniref:DNA-binding transcriptional ArsR family regulator n=1 Tax=Nocardia tenerifensis TaxID=228006 RepID=A0A318K4K1_9NOCA|nr:helix-turn-helix domain-containing protein [Nocardia tenerifensis]PXX64040.1 DNA-binding transcriptional ArsR family regulator [Nocardia tenerifensis]
MTPRTGDDMTSAERTALYRTLAHPLRARILAYLGKHGEANSAALATELGESTGSTSYHLRKLAELGLITEIAEKSTGRERWWKSLPFSHTTPDPATMEPAELAAAEHLARLKSGRDIELYLRAVREWAGPQGWAQVQRHGTHLTKDQVVAFMSEYRTLLERYTVDRENAPEGAEPMNIRLFAVPDAPA